MYRLEARKRNIHNKEPEASAASGGVLIAKISLLSLVFVPNINLICVCACILILGLQ